MGPVVLVILIISAVFLYGFFTGEPHHERWEDWIGGDEAKDGEKLPDLFGTLTSRRKNRSTAAPEAAPAPKRNSTLRTEPLRREPAQIIRIQAETVLVVQGDPEYARAEDGVRRVFRFMHFQMADGRVTETEVSQEVCAALREGMTGTLVHQGNRFIGFIPDEMPAPESAVQNASAPSAVSQACGEDFDPARFARQYPEAEQTGQNQY